MDIGRSGLFTADVKSLQQHTNAISAELKLLSTKQEIATRCGVSVRLVEKWTQLGVIPALRISRRLTRYELPKVLNALRAYETRTLRDRT